MQTSSLKIGTILRSSSQEYKIEKILGAGSFGITYLATSKVKHGNVTFPVKFAIKEHFMESCFRDTNGVFVHCTPTSQKNVELSRKDFLNEARRLQEICKYSNNIVHVNEAFEANGTAYYVMEYLDGGSPKQTDEKSAIEIIQQVAEAVSILHKNKLLHLDIKPDNIVLKSSENGDTYPVLIDFGITKHFDSKGRPTTNPQAKGASNGYAPIEQNDVIREFAPTLDIYALGATLLYLLTGKNPPSSVKLIDPSQRELRSLIPSNVSQETRNAILKAMSPNKNDRTQSVKTFLNNLNCNNLNLSNKRDNHTSKTTPINKGTIPHTEPIKKKKKHSNDSRNPKKLNASYWATIVALVITLISLWLAFPNIFLTGIICLVGLAIDFCLCHFLSKRLNKNSGLLFTISFFVFFIICYAFKVFLPVYIVIAEIILLMILLLAFVQGKNIIRWCTSSALLGTTCFFGYVWYSHNVLQVSDIDSKYDIIDTYIGDNVLNEATSEHPNNKIENENSSDGINYNGHDYVDLGLPSGLKWATCNMGASNPEDYGDYYAYGETIKYTPNQSNGNSKSAMSTQKLKNEGIINSNGVLNPLYDAAHINWGGSWRIPEVSDFEEIIDNCTWTFTSKNGIKGYLITGKNNKFIFLPAGSDFSHNILRGNNGLYLSSTNENDYLRYLYFSPDDIVFSFLNDDIKAISIRPVSK